MFWSLGWCTVGAIKVRLGLVISLVNSSLFTELVTWFTDD